jgi:group I intron endonuclease
MFVYCITNSVNGKVYVGVTARRIKQRFQEHLKHARRLNTALGRAIIKYGEKQFSIRLLATASSLEELGELEIEFIARLDATSRHRGYNIAPGGPTQFGVRRTEATKAKLRTLALGKTHSLASRAKMSAERKQRGLPSTQLDQMHAAWTAKYGKRPGWKKIYRLSAKKRDARWIVKWLDERGSRRTKLFGEKSDAVVWLDRILPGGRIAVAQLPLFAGIDDPTPLRGRIAA